MSGMYVRFPSTAVLSKRVTASTGSTSSRAFGFGLAERSASSHLAFLIFASVTCGRYVLRSLINVPRERSTSSNKSLSGSLGCPANQSSFGFSSLSSNSIPVNSISKASWGAIASVSASPISTISSSWTNPKKHRVMCKFSGRTGMTSSLGQFSASLCNLPLSAGESAMPTNRRFFS